MSPRDNDLADELAFGAATAPERNQTIAMIGAGPTTIYTLQALLGHAQATLAVTIFEEQSRAGLGTPYRPGWNDPAMLANIASIELPALGQTLVAWLAQQPPTRLDKYGIDPNAIDERAFYPRVVLGDYLLDRFESLVADGRRAGHKIEVKARSRVTDICVDGDELSLSVQPKNGPAYHGSLVTFSSPRVMNGLRSRRCGRAISAARGRSAPSSGSRRG